MTADHSASPFTDVYSRLIKILFYSDLHGTRFLLGMAEAIWAFTLLWPGSTFGRPTYVVMSHVMGEEAWGLVFAISAVTQFSILIRCEYHTAFATAFAGWNSVLWTFVVISMYLSVSPPPAAISGEAALAVGAAWVWVRSGLKLKGIRANDYGGEQ
jgi:hypothetical protein